MTHENVLEAEKSPRGDPAWASLSSNHLSKATSIVNTLSLSQASCLWTKFKNFLERGMLRNDAHLTRLLGNSTDGKEAASELGAPPGSPTSHTAICIFSEAGQTQQLCLLAWTCGNSEVTFCFG